MSKLLFSYLLLILPIIAFVQPVHRLGDSTSFTIQNYTLLRDKGYTFDQILRDSTLPFSMDDSIRTAKDSIYWLKMVVHNPSHYTQQFAIWMSPYLHNTLYYFNADTDKWVADQAGVIKGLPTSRRPGDMHVIVQGNSLDTIYIKAEFQSLQKFDHVFKPTLFFKQQASVDKWEEFVKLTWIVSLTALFLFFINNLYVYYSFRDKTILYYLIAQIGTIVYITSYRHYSNLFFPNTFFSLCIDANGKLNYYNWSSLLIHGSVLLIMYCFIQLTRSYLNSPKTLPVFDKILKNGLLIYLFISIVFIIINVFFVYLDTHFLIYENIMVLLLIAAIMCTSVAGYIRKLPNSGPFLVSNMLPLVFMLGITLFHVFISFEDTAASILPDMAIITQALVFSIVLVARMKSIRNELAEKEKEAQQLAFDIKEIEILHNAIEVDNQKINEEMQQEKSRNEMLQQKLEANQRELASTSLYIVQKNEMLASLKNQIKDLNKLYPDNKHHGLLEIESILQSNQYLDADWGKFKVHFEQVHPLFFENLQAKYPSLTKNEQRLYAYFHINLSTKEIAAMLNIDPASVRQAKARLNKKMATNEAVNN